MVKELFLKFSQKKIYHDIIESLVAALEAKDLYTRGHSDRVADMSYEVAKGLGISGSELEEIHMAAHLHDIGKIGVPDNVLNKNGKLAPHEWEYMKMHPVIGYKILSKSKRLKAISEIVLYHHERWDGKGYPGGISQADIPIGSRIIAVCDAIDAMTSDRPYRKAMSFETCLNELNINKGIMFDPVVVDYILNNEDDLKEYLDCEKI